jgi:high-affinity nickel-transport protein
MMQAQPRAGATCRAAPAASSCDLPGGCPGELPADQPWQLRIVALATAAHRAGLFSWPDFQQELLRELADDSAAAELERAEPFPYEAWIGALEAVLGVPAASPPAEPAAARAAWWRRTRSALTGREWARLGLMAAVIAAVNGFGWGIYLLCVMPHHFNYQGLGGSRGLGVGLGVAVTAWFLGFRHAFDADHISCIDNTTRKLMADGKRPIGSGFFFSLGHSSVVVAVGIGITFAAKAVFGAVVNPDSAYETLGGTIGTVTSASFLYLIAVLNLIVMAGIFSVFRGMRKGSYDEAQLEAQLQARGLMYRFFGRFMRSINHTWQLFFVGLVFGIGFDTVTEVVLLAATAYAAIQGLPYYAILALPLLFSGGLMLFDTLDGCFMNFAYGWAFARPVRKVYYNLVITGLSIAAAFVIGSIELLGVLASELRLHGAFWDTMANFNINVAGFVIAGLFVVTWVAAIAYWKLGQVERRWQRGVSQE